jgi:predicted membrane protein
MSSTRNSTVRLLTGFVLIIIGSLYLLKNFGFFEFDILEHIISFPSLLIFVGIVITINASQKGFGIFLIAVGSIWHYAQITDSIDFGKLILPLILLGLGLYIIFKQRKSDSVSNTEKNYSNDTIEDIAIFGGGNKTIISNSFKGGNITSVFGGSEIDLTRCQLADGNQIIDVLAVFGGSTLLIPSDWNVIVDVLPIFGGFSNKSNKHFKDEVNVNKTLIIKGLVIFGGGEIKRY